MQYKVFYDTKIRDELVVPLVVSDMPVDCSCSATWRSESQPFEGHCYCSRLAKILVNNFTSTVRYYLNLCVSATYFIIKLFVIGPIAPFPAAIYKVYSNKQLIHRAPVTGAGDGREGWF